MRPWKQHELNPGKLLVVTNNNSVGLNRAKSMFMVDSTNMLPLDVIVEGQKVAYLAYAPYYGGFAEKIHPRVLFLGFDTVLSTSMPLEIERYREGGSKYIQSMVGDCISYRDSQPIKHRTLSTVLTEVYHYGFHTRARFLCTKHNGDSIEVGILHNCKVGLTAQIKANFIPMEAMEATYRSRFPKCADEIIAKINAGI